jgi:hypothetical protein
MSTGFAAIRLRREAIQARSARAKPTIEGRLRDLSESMKRSARLIEQVNAELEIRAAAAQQLEREAKAAEALAEVNREQKEAIRLLFDAELEGAERRIRRDSVIIGVASFVAGIGATILVTLLLS